MRLLQNSPVPSIVVSCFAPFLCAISLTSTDGCVPPDLGRDDDPSADTDAQVELIVRFAGVIGAELVDAESRSVAIPRNAVPDQVLIEAKIVEVDGEKIAELGIDWRLLEGSYFCTSDPNPFSRAFSADPYRAGGARGTQTIVPADIEPHDYPLTAVGPGREVVGDVRVLVNYVDAGLLPEDVYPLEYADDLRPGRALDIGFGLGAYSWLGGIESDIAAILDAIKSTDDSVILSSPKVTVFNGQTAGFVGMNNFPYIDELKEPFQDEVAEINAEIKTVGTGPMILVTPNITKENEIKISITPGAGIIFPQPDMALIGGREYYIETPVFDGANAHTTMLIKDGETIVIGGIKESKDDDGEAGVPLLGHIPVLGHMFRSRGDLTSKHDLIIFVTARISDPAGM